jgi:ABC-type nitrate/sulfonate/bicarbonate transport system permease component
MIARMDARWAWRAGSIGVTVAIFALWGLVTQLGLVSRVFLPGPLATLQALWQNLLGGELAVQALETLRRMLLGWLLASFFGIGLGALIGSSAGARKWMLPTLELLRPLPASALLPVGIALFGLTPGMLLATVAFGAVWPVLLATVHGFTSVDVRLREVAQVLGFPRTNFVFKFGFPNALPDILSGMRLSLTASLIVTVVGELLTAQTGLGSTIMLAARSYRSTDLYAGVIVLGVIGFANNALLGLAERRLLRWQQP